MQCMLHLWNKLKSQLNWAGLLLWYYSYINMHVDIQLLLWQTVKSPWSKHSTWRHFLHFFCILKTIQTKKEKKRNVTVDITLNTEWTLICITWHKTKTEMHQYVHCSCNKNTCKGSILYKHITCNFSWMLGFQNLQIHVISSMYKFDTPMLTYKYGICWQKV